MTKERAREICFLIVENEAIKGGIPSPEAFRRGVGNLAKGLDVSQGELYELAKMFLPKVIGKVFDCTGVSVEMSIK